MNPVAIEARQLCKTFPPAITAVRGLDLTVPRGTVYGLIGRNGAGKSTLLRCLMGLLRPDSGHGEVLGHELWHAPREVRRRVAYVSQEQQLPWWMTARELGAFYQQLYHRWDQEFAARTTERFDLDDRRPMGVLSGGDQRRVAVLLALAAQPDVVILDEPAAGLDPISRRQLIEALVEFLGDGGQRTVLFSTHILADLERVADHVGFMDRGRLVMGGPLDSLQAGLRRVQVIFDGDRVPEGFRLPGQVRGRSEGPVLTAVVRCRPDQPAADLAAGTGARVSETPLGLEDLFLELMESEKDRRGDPTLVEEDPWWRNPAEPLNPDTRP